MSIVGHTYKATIRDRLEVSVASEGSIMLMHFFVAMRSSPHLIVVLGFWYDVLHRV